MRVHGKYVVISALLLLSAGLAFDSLSSFINPYLSVRQVIAGWSQYAGKSIQIMGVVAYDSLLRGSEGVIRFDITDGKETLGVVYSGSLPQNFDQGKEVVIVGTIKGSGLIEASSILVKCPSKYQDEGASPLGNHLFLAAMLLAIAAGAYFAYSVLWRRG